MDIKVSFSAFQKSLKDFKAIVAKSPLSSSEDAKDLGALVTAEADGTVKLEAAIKGFYVSSIIPGEVKEAGSAVLRVESVTSLKASLTDANLTCQDGDKVLKLRSGKFKADIPIHHDVDDISVQRPEKLEATHSIHSTKLAAALGCVDLETAAKDDAIFAKFVFDPSGFTCWANSPSTAALYRNVKSAFDEQMEVVLPVDLLVSYLSKVTGKVQLAVDSSLFQLTADELEISHPLREADVFDIKSSVDEIVSDKEYLIKFTSVISETLECLVSVSGFAPEDSKTKLKIDPKKNAVVCSTSSPAGEGENQFAVTSVDAQNNKEVEFVLNCKVVLKLLDSVKSLQSDDVTWFVLKDRILLQGKDGSVSYICAQMD